MNVDLKKWLYKVIPWLAGILPAGLAGGTVLVTDGSLPSDIQGEQWIWLSAVMTIILPLWLAGCIVNSQRTVRKVLESVQWVLIGFGAVEALHGLGQIAGIYPSNHSLFVLTGTFYNPGPYSGYLAAVLPIALFRMLVLNGKNDRLSVEPYSCFQQNALLRTFKSDSYTYFQHKIGTFYVKYRAGIIYENRYLQSLLYTDTHLVDNKDYSNKVRLETVETYIEPSLNLKTAYWDLQFRFPLTYHYSKLKNTLPHLNTESKHKLLPTPSLNLKYNLNAYWNISATSTLGFLKPDIRRLYAGYLFDTYRSAQSFTQGLIYDKNMYNLLRLRYNNPLNGLFISFNGIFSQTWQDYIYIYNNQEDVLSISQSCYYPNSKKNYGGSIRLSKATGWSKLFTALSASYNKIDDNIMLESDLVKSTLSFLSLGADVSLQPSRYINIEASSRATNVQSKLDLDTPTAVQTWSYEHLLNVNLIFSSKWRASMENFLTHNNQSKYLTYFADASVTYNLKKWLFELELHNIFNHSTLYNNYISNWTQQTSKYSLRQREVLLKAAFSF